MMSRRLVRNIVRSCLVLGAIALVSSAWAVAEGLPRPLPPQALADALDSFAKYTGLQVVYRAELTNGLQSKGAEAGLSAEQALRAILRDTGLSFQFVNERTVTLMVVPKTSDSRSTTGDSALASERRASSSAGSGADSSKDDGDRREDQKKSFWDRFRLAQVDQGQVPSDRSVGTQGGGEQPSSAVLEEVVVTAQKREERLRDVPMSVSVLAGKDLDRSSGAGVTDALNLVPGVVAAAGAMGGGTQITVRGVGASGPLFNGSSPVGYYLDSVPFGLVKNAIAPDSDAYDLARVEVLRGPQGTLYGASAQNGVVRVLTQDADLSAFEFKARTTLSETNGGGGNYRGDAAINVPVVEGKLAARAIVGYQNLSGWINTPRETHANDAVLRNYRLKINAQPTDNFSVGLSAWSSNDDYGAPSSASDNGRISGSLDQPIHNSYEAYGLRLGYELPRLSISSMTSYLHYSSDSILDLTAIGATGFGYHTFLPANVLSEEINLSSSMQSSWRWTAGAFYRDATDRQLQQLLTIALQDYTNHSESWAIFGQVGRRFGNDKFEWGLGARYFHDDVSNRENVRDPALATPTTAVPLYVAKNSFDSTTPRAVLSWYPNPTVTLYGSYAEGFRSGFPQNASVAVPNRGFPPLKPDKLHNYEIGAKADLFDRRISFETAVYYMKWNDVQQTLSVPYNNGQTTVVALINGQSASGPGVDLAVTARPIKALDFGISLSWNDLVLDSAVQAEGALLFDKGDRLNYSPEFTGGAFADVSFPIGAAGYEARFSTSANYSSKQTNRGLAPGVFVLSGGALLNARASLGIVAPDRWTATLFVDNLTNESDGLPPIVPGPDLSPRIRPRTVGVQVDFNFR
jgi:iron complex outermembrane receptor protein